MTKHWYNEIIVLRIEQALFFASVLIVVALIIGMQLGHNGW